MRESWAESNNAIVFGDGRLVHLGDAGAPAVLEAMQPTLTEAVLVKPQFEAGREHVGKGGSCAIRRGMSIEAGACRG
jgi:hypothetical protein